MAQDLRPLEDWVLKTHWPPVACPTCGEGFVIPDDAGLVTVDSGDSILYRDHDDWEPEWLTGRFHAVLNCQSPACRETVVIAGDYKVDYVHGPDGKWYGEWGSYVRLRFARPAFRIFSPPSKTPDAVKQAIVRGLRGAVE